MRKSRGLDQAERHPELPWMAAVFHEGEGGRDSAIKIDVCDRN